MALRAALSSASFFAVFSVATVILRQLAPEPPVPEISEKFRWLEAKPKAYNVFFIGSSRVRRHLSPDVFDAEVAKAGLQVRSYNFGIDGMTSPELSYVLERMLAKRRGACLAVVMDINGLRQKIEAPYDESSPRQLHWHDWKHTASVCESILRAPQAHSARWDQRLALLVGHLRLMFERASALGGAVRIYQRTSSSTAALPSYIREGRGYAPVRTKLSGAVKAKYENALGEMKAGPRPLDQYDPALGREFQRLTELVESAGAQPIFFVAPTTFVPAAQIPRPRPDGTPLTLSFDRPEEYPALYAPENRYDVQHLNADGAAELTKYVAAAVATVLKETATPVYSAR
jgi:hypothetical protein